MGKNEKMEIQANKELVIEIINTCLTTIWPTKLGGHKSCAFIFH